MDERLLRLSDIGDQLEASSEVVDLGIFQPDLHAALAYGDGAKGGRPPYDPVMMVKILVIQAQNNLSDDRAEFLINDRLSFMRVFGLGLTDKVPDAKTIFSRFARIPSGCPRAPDEGGGDRVALGPLRRRDPRGRLHSDGRPDRRCEPRLGPKQRNTETEKAEIKAGRIPEGWQDKPAKLRQKDRDARWTLVFGKARERADGHRHADIAIPVFGYKPHASIDRRHHAPRAPLRDVIRRWDVTDAAAHEGRMLRRGLLDKTNTGSTVWADSAYRSKANADASRPSLRDVMKKHGFHSQVHHRMPRGRPMAPHIRRGNASRSAVRAGIEHVFARQKGTMDLCIRTVGISRARAKIGLANLTYNIRRLVFLGRRHGLI